MTTKEFFDIEDKYQTRSTSLRYQWNKLSFWTIPSLSGEKSHKKRRRASYLSIHVFFPWQGSEVYLILICSPLYYIHARQHLSSGPDIRLSSLLFGMSMIGWIWCVSFKKVNNFCHYQEKVWKFSFYKKNQDEINFFHFHAWKQGKV
jgi:hypothetical protein